MSNDHKPPRYRDAIDALVRMCREGQGQIAANRVREGSWSKVASDDLISDQPSLEHLLNRLSTTERNMIAELLAAEVVTGVFETLKVLEEFKIEPFTEGYEGGPYHDFVGRLAGCNWPKSEP